MFNFATLALIGKLAKLRDEAARATALLPQINAAIAAPTISGKLELFAPISSEICAILASGLKDFDMGVMASDNLAAFDDFQAQECEAGGYDYAGVKDFFAKLQKLFKELQPYISVLLPLLVLED